MQPKHILVGVAAVAMQAFVMAPSGANAFSITGGPADLKFTGVTAEDAGVTTGNSGGKETTFGAGYLNEIIQHGSNNVLWAQGTGPSSPNESISFFLYGIADRSFGGTGPFSLDNGGCTVGAGCDGKIHIDFYLDHLSAGGGFPGTNPTFNSATGVQASQRSGFSTLPGITDGQLLMSWVLIPGADKNDPGATLFQKVDALSLPTNGSGTFLANCVTGPGCSFFNTSTISDSSQQADPTAVGNFFGQFTLSTPGPLDQGFVKNGWEGLVADPAFTGSVPELSTWAMMLIGFGAVGLRVRRQRVTA